MVLKTQIPKITLNCTHLTSAAFIIWAVILVYDNGVLDIDHDNVLKKDVPHISIARFPPRLYPDTILSASECSGFNSHILHTRLIHISP